MGKSLVRGNEFLYYYLTECMVNKFKIKENFSNKMRIILFMQFTKPMQA